MDGFLASRALPGALTARRAVRRRGTELCSLLACSANVEKGLAGCAHWCDKAALFAKRAALFSPPLLLLAAKLRARARLCVLTGIMCAITCNAVAVGHGRRGPATTHSHSLPSRTCLFLPPVSLGTSTRSPKALTAITVRERDRTHPLCAGAAQFVVACAKPSASETLPRSRRSAHIERTQASDQRR